MNNETNKPISEDDALLFALFDKWAQELKENGKENKQLVAKYAAATGIDEKGPLALMFSAFLGGIDKGLELAEVFAGKEPEQ